LSLPNSANPGYSDGPGYPVGPAAPGQVPAPVEKQHTNVFTMMLMVSFLALVLGSVMFAMEWQRFPTNPPWDTTKGIQAPAAPSAP
jgi:hypothetical protein